MAFDFPSSPSEGQIFSPPGGPSYQYIASKWVVASPVVALATITEVLTGTDAAHAVTSDALAALWEQNPSLVAPAANISLGEGGSFVLSGAPTAINLIVFAVPTFGRRAWVRVGSAAAGSVLVSSGSMLLPYGQNIILNNNDYFEVMQTGTGSSRLTAYFRADAPPVGITMGTYTPTVTLVSNMTAAVLNSCMWTRYKDSVNDFVDVAGNGTFDPVAVGQASIGVSLPIPSNIGTLSDLAGNFCSGSIVPGHTGYIIGDSTNDRAAFTANCESASNALIGFQFRYRVLP